MDLDEELTCTQRKGDNQCFIQHTDVTVCRKPRTQSFILNINKSLQNCELNVRNGIGLNKTA